MQPRPTTSGLILPSRRSWTRSEFERASCAGVFGPEERLELIEGEIVEKMTPQNFAHATAILAAEEVLRAACGGQFHVRAQMPLAVGEFSAPEPDLAVVRGTFRDHTQHPGHAVLLVEVADSSLSYDRSTKASIYARAAIPEYWIVNLPDGVLEVYREPGAMAEQPLGHHYHNSMTVPAEGLVHPLWAPSTAMRVADLLP